MNGARAGIGLITSLLGVFLFFGNIGGFFRTFPFAGFVTMSIGGAILNDDETFI
jgi:hypothetical protein